MREPEWLRDKQMKHPRGAPYHPMRQGKIERWHQMMKNRVLLEHYYLPGDLEARIDSEKARSPTTTYDGGADGGCMQKR
jgi:transposase InsO family protein